MSESEKSSGSVVSSEESSSELSSSDASSLWESLSSSSDTSSETSSDGSSDLGACDCIKICFLSEEFGAECFEYFLREDGTYGGESFTIWRGDGEWNISVKDLSIEPPGEGTIPLTHVGGPATGNCPLGGWEYGGPDPTLFLMIYPCDEGSSGGSESSSDVSESSGSDLCPYIWWSFAQTNTNDWTPGLGNRHVELRIQASGSVGGAPGGCGGTNTSAQSGTATGTVVVPAGKVMTFDWDLEAIVEQQAFDFDTAYYEVDGVIQIERIMSDGNDLGCTDGVKKTLTGTTILTAGTHTLAITYDTFDGRFHKDNYGVDFKITSCELSDSP